MYPSDLKYAKTHEWARLENGIVTVGITSHAAEELSDVVYVELPSVGDPVEQGLKFAMAESVKAVGEVYAPVTGKVVATNEKLKDEPGLINEDPYGAGWLASIEPAAGATLDGLMDAKAYEQLVASEKGA